MSVRALLRCAVLLAGTLLLSSDSRGQGDLALLAEGHPAARWNALPQEIMVPAVVLLLEAPLALGVAVGALCSGLRPQARD